jgi:UDP-N-acetylglucosamine 4,6-dehydratase/5-epimerase
MRILGNKILITGGTGTLGQALVRELSEDDSIDIIRIYSRDEFKQQQMKSWAGEKCRFFIGDVRDKERLDLAMEDVDIVIHAAALKQIDTGEYNPFEFVKTNVLGTQNVIDCAMKHDIKQVLLISSDKAVNPINLYGATKLCAEKLIVAANNYKGTRETKFKYVRYGNVWGSRGSVLEQWEKETVFNVRDLSATRYHITIKEALELIRKALSEDGDGWVPDLPSYTLKDLANAYSELTGKRYIIGNGILKGEKLHESLSYGTTSFEAKRLDMEELRRLLSSYLSPHSMKLQSMPL